MLKRGDGDGTQGDDGPKRCPCEEISHFRCDPGDATYQAAKIGGQDVNQASIEIKLHFRIKCQTASAELPCTEEIKILYDNDNVLGGNSSKGGKASSEEITPATATVEGKKCNGAENTPKNDPISCKYTATFDKGASAENKRLFLVIPQNCEKKETAWKFEVAYTTHPGKDPHANITAETSKGKPVDKKEIEKLTKAKIL